MAKTVSETGVRELEKGETDPELEAMAALHAVLRGLAADAQTRVIEYVIRRLALNPRNLAPDAVSSALRPGTQSGGGQVDFSESHDPDTAGGLEGISPVAQKWMRRNGLQPVALSALFSLGVDEIDLVAKTVPGKTKKERMRSVLLLLGVAGYLSTGAARIPDDKLREACIHYDAYDLSNFSAYMKTLNAEASGSKESGYTLTARGLTSATDLVKQITTKV